VRSGQEDSSRVLLWQQVPRQQASQVQVVHQRPVQG
jgi:hypothetical protein